MNGVKPNEYDLIVTGNGCGSEGLKSVIGTSNFLNFIFKPACQMHDFNYSKYSKLTRKQADNKFYADMIELIKKGNYGFFKRIGYTLIAKDYWRLVRWYGKSSFSEYDKNATQPSFVTSKNIKLRKIECVFIEGLNRWYTKAECIFSAKLGRWVPKEQAKLVGLLN